MPLHNAKPLPYDHLYNQWARKIRVHLRAEHFPLPKLYHLYMHKKVYTGSVGLWVPSAEGGEIYIDSSLNRRPVWYTVAHEMRHWWQYHSQLYVIRSTEQVTESGISKPVSEYHWKGSDLVPEMSTPVGKCWSYIDDPREKDALLYEKVAYQQLVADYVWDWDGL